MSNKPSEPRRGKRQEPRTTSPLRENLCGCIKREDRLLKFDQATVETRQDG